MWRMRVSDSDRGGAPRPTEDERRQRPAGASPSGEERGVDPDSLVCPACANTRMTERGGAVVCEYCGYSRRSDSNRPR